MPRRPRGRGATTEASVFAIHAADSRGRVAVVRSWPLCRRDGDRTVWPRHQPLLGSAVHPRRRFASGKGRNGSAHRRRHRRSAGGVRPSLCPAALGARARRHSGRRQQRAPAGRSDRTRHRRSLRRPSLHTAAGGSAVRETRQRDLRPPGASRSARTQRIERRCRKPADERVAVARKGRRRVSRFSGVVRRGDIRPARLRRASVSRPRDSWMPRFTKRAATSSPGSWSRRRSADRRGSRTSVCCRASRSAIPTRTRC